MLDAWIVPHTFSPACANGCACVGVCKFKLANSFFIYCTRATFAYVWPCLRCIWHHYCCLTRWQNFYFFTFLLINFKSSFLNLSLIVHVKTKGPYLFAMVSWFTLLLQKCEMEIFNFIFSPTFRPPPHFAQCTSFLLLYQLKATIYF